MAKVPRRDAFSYACGAGRRRRGGSRLLATGARRNIHVLWKQGVSYAAIGRDGRTVQQASRPERPPRYPRVPRGSQLAPYRPSLGHALAAGQRRATRLCRALQAQGYPGGAELVKVYARQCPRAQRQQATGRFETRPGLRDCCISSGANRYAVPRPDGGQRLPVKADPTQRRICADPALIATPALASGTGQAV
jgi:hypothetical protein